MFVSMPVSAMLWHSVGIFVAGLVVGGLIVYGVKKASSLC